MLLSLVAAAQQQHQCHLATIYIEHFFKVLLPSFKDFVFIHQQLPTLVSDGVTVFVLAELSVSLIGRGNRYYCPIIVHCYAFRFFCNAVYHCPPVYSSTRFHLLVLSSVLLSLQLFQSLRSGSPKLLFDLPLLIHSPACFGTNPV